MSEDDPNESNISRHAEVDQRSGPPADAGRNLEDLTEHIEKHVGGIGMVYHEIVSDVVHLDVMHVPAAMDRPFQMLVTSGASDLPMTGPDGNEVDYRIELFMLLPPEWPISQEAFEDENHYWPIRSLKEIARLPHSFGSFLGYGHTVPNGDPPEAIANTSFIGFMLSLPYRFNASFAAKDCESGDQVRFLELVPLFPEEMDLKLKKGAEHVDDLLQKSRDILHVDQARPNVGLRKKRWWQRG